ncbi:hypothetical protein QAD02_020792 [Eretmocerus hayati]|uniref:Uncharacterized protein n=1 Tax=Eretmocerus hayati TaxID=131215 RepID=A0ACC2PN19_9HYME|nr:hypothetical protein QAD02_020792 [Eretmocerus hayati]
MESAKRNRTVHRALFTKSYKSFVEKCKNAEQTVTDRHIALELLESKMVELKNANGKYIDLLLTTEKDEEVIQNKIESQDEYIVNLMKARAQLVSSPTTTLNSISMSAPQNSAHGVDKPFKRPTYEIPEFSESINEWLQFWSHFRKVHEDQTFSKEDKLEFLQFFVVKGSEAAVSSVVIPSMQTITIRHSRASRIVSDGMTC